MAEIPVRTCIVCGCTEDLACVDEINGPCSWRKLIGRDKGVCSSCPLPVDARRLTAAQKRERRELAEKVGRIARHRRLMAQNFRTASESYDQVADQMRYFEISMQRATNGGA